MAKTPPSSSVILQTPAVQPASRQPLSWRAATLERSDTLISDTLSSGFASTQRIERTVEGTGFIYGIVLNLQVSGGVGTVTAAAYAEDAPYSAFDTVILRDPNGELLDVSGFSLYLANLCNANYRGYYTDVAALATPVPVVSNTSAANAAAVLSPANGGVQPSTTINVLTASADIFGSGPSSSPAGIHSALFTALRPNSGNINFMVRVPVAINRRDILGTLGNQDRAWKALLRSDLAALTATGPVFSTLPGTNVTQAVINRYYESYAVPLPVGPTGQPQMVLPSHLGTLHFTTQTTSEAAPAASSTVSHYVRRLGNSIRWLALTFRSGSGASPRFTGDGQINLLRVKFGEDPVYTETPEYRRYCMRERYGFEFPLGVILYDNMHDFIPFSGNELGDDYWNTQTLSQAKFDVTYGTGWAAGSSLQFLTDDLQFASPQVAGM